MSRRFFSGRTLQAAVLAAASHYGIEPEELAYEEIDKRHGFLKNRSKVVIAVDPAGPRREPKEAREEPASRAEAPPAPAEREAERAPAAPEPGSAAESEPSEPEEEPQERPRRSGRRREGRKEPAAAAEPEEPAAAAGAEADEDSPPARPGRGRRSAYAAEADEERPGRDAKGARSAAPAPPRDALMELPDQPRALRDRYGRAEGPLAEAAEQAVAAIAAVAGLEIEATILQGDDRLEIDLAGPHSDLLVAEDGELLVAIEHLLPRVMRGYGGETAAVRVDCENFQEIREERLRSFAQQVAGEVRSSGRAKSLDPLSPADRRIVHLTVADEPGVESESEGSGYLKRVRISPA